MSIKNIRLEVMQFLENKVESFVDEYLIPVVLIGSKISFVKKDHVDGAK